MNLLLVDDERAVREGMARKIEKKFDIRVSAAADGKEAYNLFCTNHYEFIMTDIRMPVWDGLELIKRVREESSNVMITVFTAYADFNYAQKAIKYHVNNFLVKPISVNALLKEIGNLIQSNNELQRNLRLKKESYYTDLLHGLAMPSPKEEKLLSLVFGFKLFGTGDDKTDFSPLDSGLIYYALKNVMWELSFNIYEKVQWQMVKETNKQFFLIFLYREEISRSKVLEYERNIKAVVTELEHVLNVELQLNATMVQDAACYFKDIYRCYLHLSDQLEHISVQCLMIDHLSSEFGAEKAMASAVKKKDFTLIHHIISELYTDKEDTYHLKWRLIRMLQYLYISFEDLFTQIHISFKDLLAMFDLKHNDKSLSDIEDKIKAISGMLSNRNIKSMHPIIRSIEKDIRTDLSNTPLLKEYAEKYHMNSAYLSELFVKEMGESFSEFVAGIKIEEAKRLLMIPSIKVYEVADSLGYVDGRYFSQMFKRFTGKTPKEYQGICEI